VSDVGALVNAHLSRVRVSDEGDPAGLPPAVPPLASNPARACVTTTGTDQADPGPWLDPVVPESTAVARRDTVSGGVLADRVHVARGKGAVVVSAASPTAPATAGTVSIVTDAGIRFPLAGRDLLAKLGYGGIAPRPVPAQMIALLPQGPSLDAVQARKAAPGG
jgi:ESX secretion system ATPase EccB